MSRLTTFVPALALLAALAACGDKPQTLTHVKNDVPAYEGAKNEFPAPDWKRGDKASWEAQLKARMWNSQNEYSKTNAAH